VGSANILSAIETKWHYHTQEDFVCNCFDILYVEQFHSDDHSIGSGSSSPDSQSRNVSHSDDELTASINNTDELIDLTEEIHFGSCASQSRPDQATQFGVYRTPIMENKYICPDRSEFMDNHSIHIVYHAVLDRSDSITQQFHSLDLILCLVSDVRPRLEFRCRFAAVGVV
jgi:hypothetical protein